MILECGDLERALRTPELMPDMRAHAEQCAACGEQLHLWSEISRLAPGLHEEWESPFLWPRIQANLAAEPRGKAALRAPWWRWALAAAGVVAAGGDADAATVAARKAGRAGSFSPKAHCRKCNRPKRRTRGRSRSSRRWRRENLDRSSSPMAAAYREKLTLLDSGIADLKATVENNRYNTYLQIELASLYRQKQQTLQEWLQNANHN